MTDKNLGVFKVTYYGKTFSMEFDNGITIDDMVDEVIAPMLIAMGYFPSNVYDALNLTDTTFLLKKHYGKGEA